MTARPMTPTRSRPPECCNMVAVKSALWVLLLRGCPLAKLKLVHANTKYRTALEIPLVLSPQRDASPPVRNARASASCHSPRARNPKTATQRVNRPSGLAGDRLQRSRLVCRLGAGEPGDLQGDPADQQVENTTDGVANAGSDLECRLVLNLVCDTRDVASTRQRTLPLLSRFYGEVLPWAVRVSIAEVTVSRARWPAEEVDQRCCPY